MQWILPHSWIRGVKSDVFQAQNKAMENLPPFAFHTEHRNAERFISERGNVLFKGNVKQGLETRWAVTLSSALSLLIVFFLAVSVQRCGKNQSLM